MQQHFGVSSVADAAGQDVVSAGGFAANTTYLFVGKISGHGLEANTMQASLFSNGATVANFTDPGFQWMLSAASGAGYNPIITDLKFTSRAETNYTVSNVWIGNAATILPPTLTSQGDFNQDGIVNSSDFVVWRNTMGQTGSGLAADGNGDYQINVGDLTTWRAHFGQALLGAGAELEFNSSISAAVPESSAFWLAMIAIYAALFIGRWPWRRTAPSCAAQAK